MLNASARGLTLQLSSGVQLTEAYLSVSRLQLDNLLPTSRLPVMLQSPSSAASSVSSSAGVGREAALRLMLKRRRGGEGLGRDGEGGGCGQRGKVEEVRHQGGAVRGGLEEDAVLVEGAVRHEPVAILGLDHDARPHAAEGRHHEGAVAGQDAALDVQLERPDQVFPRVVPKYIF